MKTAASRISTTFSNAAFTSTCKLGALADGNLTLFAGRLRRAE